MRKLRLACPGVGFAALVAAAQLFSACSSTDSAAKLTRELLSMPKEEAYAKGEALVAKKKYDLGRQYLRFVAENYANDPIGKQAALKLADSFFDQKTPLGYLEAQARYRDFRNRYPSHPRSDYALFRLAQCADRQAESPDKDQANTRLAATSYRELIQAYPVSPYLTEARTGLLRIRNLLAEHEYRVAQFYLHRRAWNAAKTRYDTLLGAFPDYGALDRALYEAGLAEKRLGHDDDSRLLWERLARDYPKSRWARKLNLPPSAAGGAEPAAVQAGPASGTPPSSVRN